LEEVGQERLFPESPKPPGPNADSKTQSEWTIDRAFHLQKIVRSILLNFLELVGTLSQDATQTESKIGHLTNLFVNAFHILNEYRPHQARETLILLMEEQVERRKNEIQAMKMMKERVDDMATALPQGDGAQTNGHASGITNGNGHSAGNQIWLELDD
jgi:mediator of RNA polymerase II transcription subunit 7